MWLDYILDMFLCEDNLGRAGWIFGSIANLEYLMTCVEPRNLSCMVLPLIVGSSSQSWDFTNEIMTPSLMNILKDNTLTGDNYVTWKRKIGLLLQSEKHKFVLTTPKPPAPNNESSIMCRDEYEQWKT
ncbi:hypothetical protein LWI28_028668 [Acer negundo]|uniref:Uncharacterized protein n=1 Tax=Acer negundo TaxID=4023 RepID=A0AAD5INI7_ACENE|nr:hypothetical protein LWI28_028668 [Acer negundo]